MRIRFAAIATLAAATFAAGTAALADEGMWTFDNFPSARVKQLYGFAPDQKYLDRVRKASVRLDVGCSGSVVSKDGLVLTNRHCVSDCEADLSSPGHDYVRDGFFTMARKDEKICPGAGASILQSMTDVTQRVQKVEAGPARAAEIDAIETEACGENRQKLCQVVTLYRGGQYQLYVYDRYDDVRIAFAPELQAASFGGDPDNFNFPRYALDMALVRLYRDGKPATFTDPLKLDTAGPKAGDVLLVSSHPGTTERLLTNAQLEFQRDQFLPWRLEYTAQLRGEMLAESTKGEEEARQISETLENVENTLKVIKGQRGALVEPSFFAVKVAEEKKLRDALIARADLRSKFGDPFTDLATAVAAQKQSFLPYQMLEVRYGAGSVLMTDARALVRAAAEQGKPESERLPEFTASRMAVLKQTLLAETPIHPVLEKLQIAFWLDKTREYLGPDHPAVKALFGSRTSAQIAAEIVTSSQVGDTAFRKRIWETPALAASSNDPALALVKKADDAAHAVRAKYEAVVTRPTLTATEKVAGLRFALLGKEIYPDATFTLRMSYGVVKGWTDPVHGEIKPFTYVSGLWDRATGAFPFNLAPRWINGQSKLPGATQFNFVSTNDVVGGSSGSPALNKEGRIVGLVFDGNIHSTGGAYGYDPALNRTVSVSSQMIIEALRKIYGAAALADEMQK
ncbi:MAG TPA: S46 family peptidase [Hyphomonadaceae bacterium]|nr:S46 family peptidase [Hyphomonadaceae bacterium]HPN07597.1 S46 family peptidase [Hyphomonadaceae bacterium]